MRVLFLTNFYQTGMGGEEQSCQQVVEGLTTRGHATLVLTSMHGTNNVPVEADGLYRSLYLEMDLVPWRHSLTFFTRRQARERENLRRFKRVLAQFKPDIIFIWGMWNLPKSLPALAEAMYPDTVIYRFATYWPTLPSQHNLYWSTPGRKWYSRLPKRLVATLALAMVAREDRQRCLKFERTLCVSVATRRRLVEAGIPVSQARIVYSGLDANLYLKGEPSRRAHDGRPLNLLYAGRLTPDKGVDTAIKAMADLVNEQGQRHISMSLAGSGSPEYESHLRRLVAHCGLTDSVRFLGWRPPDAMPDLFRQHDVLLLPSIWPEPFARVVLEGMISGMVVIATPTGGTAEIIVDGENGLLFTPDDPRDLAQKVALLIHDPPLRKKLEEAGHQTVMQKFTATRMLDEIESFLQDVASAGKGRGGA